MKEARKIESEPLPESLEELEQLRLDLLADIADIQGQLASRKADIDDRALASGQVDAYGKPMSDRAEWADYNRWRGSAASACRYKQLELSEVKSAIKAKRTARGLSGLPGDIAVIDMEKEPLAALYHCARRLAAKIGFDNMEPGDQVTIESVQEILTHRDRDIVKT